jgi:hypothetical protein
MARLVEIKNGRAPIRLKKGVVVFKKLGNPCPQARSWERKNPDAFIRSPEKKPSVCPRLPKKTSSGAFISTYWPA